MFQINDYYLDYLTPISILVQYFDQDGSAMIKMEWESIEAGISRQVIPFGALTHHESCDCQGTGFTGDYCEKNINDCAYEPCLNGGTCIDELNSFSCLCSIHFSGQLCEFQIPEVCNNGGIPDNMFFKNGLRGSFFNFNPTIIPSYPLPKQSEIQISGSVNFRWNDASPFIGVQADGFAVNWIGSLKAPLTGFYNLTFQVDDGLVVHLAGVKIVDSWEAVNLQAKEFLIQNVFLDSNQHNALQIEYFEKVGFAQVVFSWESIHLGIEYQPVPSTVLFHREACDCSGTGFIGTHCEIKLNHCFPNPCQNDGVCLDEIDNFKCWCPPGFSGEHCEIRTSSNCLNGGKLSSSSSSLINGLIGKYYLISSIPPQKPTEDSNIQRVENINLSNGGTFPAGTTSTNIMIIWEGALKVDQTGYYNFYFEFETGFTLTIGNHLLYDGWEDGPGSNLVENIFLDAGSYHTIKVEYFHSTGTYKAILQWESIELNIQKQVIPMTNFYHSLNCDCTGTGFIGDKCQLNVNDCALSPCSNDFTCIDGINSRACVPGTLTSGGVFFKKYPNTFSGTVDDIFPLSNGVPTLISSGIFDLVSLSVTGDNFQLILEGYIKAETTGLHQFNLISDDGSRLYLAGSLLIDNWKIQVFFFFFFFQSSNYCVFFQKKKK